MIRNLETLTLTLALSIWAAVAQAAPGSIGRGGQLARAYCAPCHAIESEPVSPDTAAPAFRDLQKDNPRSSLDEVFARGILVSHPAMPQFGGRPQDMDDLLAYLRSVQRRAR